MRSLSEQRIMRARVASVVKLYFVRPPSTFSVSDAPACSGETLFRSSALNFQRIRCACLRRR